MRHSSLPLLLTALACLTACADRESAQHQTAGQNYRAGLALIAQAEQGFVSATAGQPKSQSLEDFRREKLLLASAELEKAAGKGSPELVAQAKLLLADLRAAEARRLTRSALNAWSELAVRSAALLRNLLEVEQAGARAKLIDADESDLIGQLQTFQSVHEGNLEAYAKDLQQHQVWIQKLQGQIEETAKTNDKAQAQIQKLRDQAFIKKGKEQYELMNRAAELERQTQVSAAKSEELGVKLSVFQAELAILQAQTELAQSAKDQLTQQIQATQDRQKTSRAQQEAALKLRDEQIQKLTDQFDALAKDHNQTVTATFEAALEEYKKAQDLLADAAAKTSGAERDHVQLEQLANNIEQVHVLGEHIQALSAYGSTVNTIAQRSASVLPDRTTFFTNHAQQLAGKQDSLILDANTLIDGATSIATALAGRGEDNPIAKAAAQQSQLLQGYRQRVEGAKLSAGAGGGA